MKKLLSMLIVAVMVFATFSMAVPTGAAGGVDEVEAYYFDVKPTIDGIVSEDEWGEMTVIVDQAEAATIEDNQPVNNRFFYRDPGAVPGFDTTLYKMYYEMWLRWDEDNFYVAVRVKDPDGHSLKNGRKETWNGDGMQFRLDPHGSNRGDGNYVPTDGKPWSNLATVPDICAGFVESAGGFTEVWDNCNDRGLTPFLGGSVNAAVVPAGASYSADSANGYTTYELQIPWGYLDNQKHDYSNYTRKNQDGGIGKEYGMSAVVYNADGVNGSRKFNAGLGWGSGIINAQQDNYTSTCAGSNLVTLSDVKVSEEPSYNASYAKGAGYNPPYYAPKFPVEVDTSRLIGPLTYDDAADMDIYGDQFFSPDGAMGGKRVQDTDGNWVVQWDEDTGDLFNSPTDSGKNESNYLSTRAQENGTYSFDGKGNYTMEFDVKVFGTEIFEDSYPCEIYNWFGGASTVEYMCGYNFDTGKFTLAESNTGKILSSIPAEFTLNEWHHWVFQYFRDSSSMRFYFDPKMTDGMVDKNETPVFEMRYRYFDMPGVESNEVILRRMNCQIMLDNVKFYNFVDFTKTGVVPPPVPGPGPAPGPRIDKKTVDINYTVTQNEDGTISLGVPCIEDFQNKDVTAVSFTVDMTKAADQATYKGIEGAPEGALEVVDNEDGTYTITVKDLSIFKDVEKDKTVFSVVIEPVAGTVLTEEQVKEIVSIKAAITTTSYSTGDAAIFFVAGAIVLLTLVGAGVVVYSKKRREIEF